MVNPLKKQSDFSRLMGYAGGHRVFTYASWVLSALSALVALVPFLYIWMILRDVLEAAPNYAQAVNIPHYGWMAVLFAVLAYLLYICSLLCSHLAAFRVATNLRLAAVEHLAALPLGFTERYGSGKLRKVIQESTGAAETYLAHQLPDQCGAMATPVGLLALLFIFDWRLGLLSLIPVVLAFGIMSAMTGKRMADKMQQYGNALAAMSNEAVEYVRGIPVVKTFGQSVFSFKKFKATIDEYEKWVIAYTKELRMPMLCYTTAINGVFAFLIAGGLLFTKNGVTSEFLLNLLFYIIITPVISLTLTKIMYMSKNKAIVADALQRIDTVLDAQPMPGSNVPQHPKDGSVTLKDVRFSYDGTDDVIRGISMNIQPGQTVALVGPSGGEQQRIAIARAMLKNAPILILDEATAFADPDNEAKVQAAFGELAKGKTVIMIAHRLSTVENADCIYVVQDGRIAESGTKDALCAKNGLFAKMWRDYQSSVQWKVAKEG